MNEDYMREHYDLDDPKYYCPGCGVWKSQCCCDMINDLKGKERIDVYDMPYEVNMLGEVRAKERVHTYWSTRYGCNVSYDVPRKKLKVDWKMKGDHKLGRVQLYRDKVRQCYYVARLVYALFNGIDYKHLTQIHYRDGDTTNLSLDNLTHSKKGMLKKNI